MLRGLLIRCLTRYHQELVWDGRCRRHAMFQLCNVFLGLLELILCQLYCFPCILILGCHILGAYADFGQRMVYFDDGRIEGR